MSHYRDVLIQTYSGRHTTSSHGIRARPLSGQGLDVNMNVECSSKMRNAYPIGTIFMLQAKITNKEGGSPFLYAHYNAPYQVVTTKEAQEFLGHLHRRS